MLDRERTQGGLQHRLRLPGISCGPEGTTFSRLAQESCWTSSSKPCDSVPALSLPRASQQGGDMWHSPAPHSAPAPVGTTAESGLIPDLVARIPWPRWALIAAAAAAGALFVCCLLCALCCCRRPRRRKSRDGETVGLRSAQGTTSAHLVQPDVDDVGPSPGGAPQWGRLQLALEYDSGSQEIRVGLKQAVDLRSRGPGGTADPYARISLSPQAGHGHETKVHRGTLCPVFDETCCFRVPPAELPQATLRVQVLDFKRFSRHEPLGELSLPLGTVDLRHVLELWHQLGPPGTTEAEQTGALCFSVRYVPGSGCLTVVVLEARGLSLGRAEVYVKVQLMLSQRKWKTRKTSARKGTATPYFNEAFTFRVPFSQIQSVDLVLTVCTRGPRFRAEPVGKVVLGTRASGQPLQHWADVLAHARRPIAQWHRLQPAREVDRAPVLIPAGTCPGS
ncbi:synaptotagmin-8 isoform 2-T2 [Molossus nigricans]